MPVGKLKIEFHHQFYCNCTKCKRVVAIGVKQRQKILVVLVTQGQIYIRFLWNR